MRVVITFAAEGDLEKIADDIAKDSPRRAETFVLELVEAAQQLGEFPEAYPLVLRFESQGIRRRPYGNYVIFYAVRTDHLTVERIFNAAQDYEALLFPEA